ncbi:MAG: NCS1 family nucleobase:cation symporter-1 [Actinomycetes bacterium]
MPHALDQHLPVAETLPTMSPRLYNEDLAPTQREGRRWRAYSIFTLWANDVHSLGNYTFSIGLFALGLGVWQILGSLAMGACFLFVLMNLSGYMGQKTGIPFPVMSRLSFGIGGAQLPALVRGAVAIAWFGIQTYLASLVFRVLLIAVHPAFDRLDHNSILGLSTLGWVCFLILWVIQVLILVRGLDMVRKYEAFAGPIILITMVALAVWMFTKAGGSIALSTDNSLSGGQMWRTMFAGGALWVTIYGTLVLNFCDFTRSAISKRSVTLGNFWGIPINTMVFAVITVVLAGAEFKINGKIITSPTDVVHSIPNTLLLVLASLALLLLTIAVNLMANFVAPSFALANLFPRHLNFSRAGIVSAVIGVLILPWNLYNSPVVIVYFLGGLGALLGPLFGVVMADYWLVRKGRVNIPDLYTTDQSGDYHYKAGVNPRAILAFVVAAVVALVVAFLPGLKEIAPFSWFFGAGLAALVYFFTADRNGSFREVSGEPIAMPSVH